MSLTFRNLVEVLHIDAPVYYTPKDKLDREEYVFCSFMGDAERDALLSGKHIRGKIYDTSGMGLHFPDIGIDEYFDLEQSRNPVSVSSRVFRLSSQMKISISDIPLVIALHAVLHEHGHWIYFLNTGMAPYEYCETERKARQPYEKMKNEIYKMHNLDPQKRKLAQEYEEIYLQFPSELAANQYAEERLAAAMEKLKNYAKLRKK